MECALNYVDPSNLIGVPKSHHEGRLTGKGIIRKKAITPDLHLFRCAHFHVLQQMSIVSEYFDEHKEVLLRDNPDCNELWLANEHMRKFISWLWDWISHSSDTQTSKYDINRYTFYTEQQNKKSTYQNSGVRVYAYNAMGQDKNMHYSQI
jgi:hypothetical protein